MYGGHDGALEHHERGGGEDAEEHAHQQVAPEGDGRLVRHASLSVGAHLRKTCQVACIGGLILLSKRRAAYFPW